jgi:hypothetical protein
LLVKHGPSTGGHALAPAAVSLLMITHFTCRSLNVVALPFAGLLESVIAGGTADGSARSSIKSIA